ncbi:(Fe-S)-binding protein [Salsuginibacillus kocurii]|uniref:(Fe-S)-binding protein n=1 Tax=Salsuginibacillus kocurii TaxID=427078 RepID=UPI001F0AC5C9|nr:(Fe-S)-binding protein [Salsuginibacillus kocurii]
MSTMEKVIPQVPSPSRLKARPHHITPDGKAKKKVAFFSGCLMETMFKETNEKTLFLLKKAGCEILIPETQNCCGALHAHSGEKEKAKELAKANIQAFEEAEIEAIISNAGGCGAILTEYDHLLSDEPKWQERARPFVSKITDVSELLYSLGTENLQLSLPAQRITYQDSCHLRNVMRTASAPRKLMNQIKGVTYVEMKESDRCCGSAGIYNLLQPEMSMQIIDHKMDHAKGTKATTIVTSNPGCLLQMKVGIERKELTDSIRAIHLIDLLAEAAGYEQEHDA